MIQVLRINFYIATIILAQSSLSGDVWDKDIAPMFQSNCVKCHGGAKKKGGLDLRSYESLIEGAESGPVIVYGSAEESELFKIVLKRGSRFSDLSSSLMCAIPSLAFV